MVPQLDDHNQLIYRLAESWNTLDTKKIEPYLSDDVEYDSHWVFETLKGKEAYLTYLEGKFQTLKAIQHDSVMHIVAEIARHNKLIHISPFIILSQYSGSEINEAALFISCKLGQICTISLSFIPDNEHVALTGERPGK